MEPLFTVHKIEDLKELGQAGVYSDSNTSTFGPAPVLKPYGTNTDSGEIKTVNVVNEFPWTNAPPLKNQDMFNARYDVPVLDLREQSIQLNPSFNNLARNLYIAGDNVATLFNSYLNIENDYVKAGVAGYITAKGASVVGSLLPGTAGAAVQGAAPLIGLGGALVAGVAPETVDNAFRGARDAVDEKLQGFTGGDFIGPLSPDGSFDRSKRRVFNNGNAMGGFDQYNQYLAPYQDIYSTKDTGWRYKLPYMEDLQRANASNWQREQIIGGGLAQKARDFTLAPNTIVSPGVYIDQAKNFVYEGQKSYSVSFPLMNTMSQDHILRNWQLLFLLTYQNRPNRIDRVQLAPPKIYEAMIPGVWWCRHAFISNMTVDFVGNRRKMTLMVPEWNMKSARGALPTKEKSSFANRFKDAVFSSILNRNNEIDTAVAQYSRPSRNMPVTTIIPDAYQVTITLTELVPESQNTMFAAIHKPSTITTSPLDQGGSIQTPFKLTKDDPNPLPKSTDPGNYHDRKDSRN